MTNTGNKIIVTGASGHIGFNVANQLLDKGYELLLLIRKENINVARLKAKGAETHICNLFDPQTYSAQLARAAGVFHLAASNTTSKSNAGHTIKNTAMLTEVFLQACVDAGVPKMVYTSSVVVLGRSNSSSKLLNEENEANFIESPYVEGKIKAEKFVSKLVAQTGVDIRRVYPAWVIGEGDVRMTPPHKIITDYVSKGQFFYFPGGISLCDVNKIAEGHISAFEKGRPGEKYVLGGENVTFHQFYSLLAKYSGYKAPFLKIPKWLIVVGAMLTKPVFKMFGMQPLLEPSYAKSVFGNYSWYDSSKAMADLNYQPSGADKIIRNAVTEARKRIAGLSGVNWERCKVPDLKQDPNKDKTLLITGAPGWLANRMIDILIKGDKNGNFASARKVKLLVQPHFKGFLNLPANFEIVYGDLSDKESLLKAVEGVQTVFHIAGAIYPKRPSILYKVNYEGTKNLADACLQKGVRRILYASTDSVSGRGRKGQRIFDENTDASPYKNYGKSKFMAEKHLLDLSKQGKLDVTSLRLFWFFGPFAPPRQRNFIQMMQMPRQLVFGNGKNLRSVSHVDNTIQAFFKAENEPKTFGKWYWICGIEKDLTVDKIYEEVCSVIGVEYKPIYIPKIFCKGFGLLDTMMGWFDMLHPSIHAAGKFYFDIAGNPEAAKRDFNYEPTLDFAEIAQEIKDVI